MSIEGAIVLLVIVIVIVIIGAIGVKVAEKAGADSLIINGVWLVTALIILLVVLQRTGVLRIG